MSTMGSTEVGTAVLSERTMRLSGLKPGANGRITSVDAASGPAIARRLQALGFVPGADVEVRRRAPLGDPTVYVVADYEMCLRRSEASLVRVQVEN